MFSSNNDGSSRWPRFNYDTFAPNQYLLHMVLQAIGKMKLSEPFQAQWAEVPLWLTSRGLTTGALNYSGGFFEVQVDFVAHAVQWLTSGGLSGQILLGPNSVSTLVETLLTQLRRAGVTVDINLAPQEVTNPIPFDQDHAQRSCDLPVVTDWWRVLLNTQHVLQTFQGKYLGKTQPIGLMWGLMDVRAAFYSGKAAAASKGAPFVLRNSLTAELMELGWSAGSEKYPRAAFYCFVYPAPEDAPSVSIGVDEAHWSPELSKWVLDYDTLLRCAEPEAKLNEFFEKVFIAVSRASHWPDGLLGSGSPI